MQYISSTLQNLRSKKYYLNLHEGQKFGSIDNFTTLDGSIYTWPKIFELLCAECTDTFDIVSYTIFIEGCRLSSTLDHEILIKLCKNSHTLQILSHDQITGKYSYLNEDRMNNLPKNSANFLLLTCPVQNWDKKFLDSPVTYNFDV